MKTKRGTTDDSNMMLLDSKKTKMEKKEPHVAKRMTKKERKRKEKMDLKANKSQHLVPIKKLTKKERKRLQKKIELKTKKTQRAELLEQLSQMMPSAEEKAMLISTSAMQSNRTNSTEKNLSQTTAADGVKVNAISGSNRKSKLKQEEMETDSDSSTSTSAVSSDDEMEVEGGDKDSLDIDSIAAVVQPDIGSKTDIQSEAVAKVQPLGNTEVTCTDVEMSNNSIKTADRQPAVHIAVDRNNKLQEQRLQLPIIMEEQTIMEAIHDNPVVIIHGETGSGKTTQVPQFLYEAGYAHGSGIIGVTEPRRVAAVCMAKRIAEEMNLTSSEVSYQIRYEGNTTDDTKIKFMTDGVLLKELQNDELLSKYRVIILDEAHERSVYTDVLIGWLSRIQRLRNQKGLPLNLVIMSATLRVEDFTDNKYLFPVTPPIVKVETRKYQVICHFNKRTDPDYLDAAYRKVCKINRSEQEGGILVFVTGQQEVHTLCAKLRRTFPMHSSSSQGDENAGKTVGKSRRQRLAEAEQQSLPKVNLDDYSTVPLDEEAEMNDEAVDDDDDNGLMNDSDNDDETTRNCSSGHTDQGLHVLPFYSLLSSDRQAQVFQPAPAGSRLCVVATNVAETSLTIPGIKYVVDTGKVKTKFYDKVTGVSTFIVTWISKASAEQRAGRAGRTGKGDCYRLYSSAVYENQFEKYTPAEITRRPVEDLVLQMKDLGILKVINFPFPTRPDVKAIEAAEKSLQLLGALSTQRDKRGKPVAVITELGRTMAHFPLAPRYARMLTLGHQHDLLPYVVAIVAALSVQEVFIDNQPSKDSNEQTDDAKRLRHRLAEIKKAWVGTGNCLLLGDVMLLLQAVGRSEEDGCSPEFCILHGLRHKAMIEVRKLRRQLTNTINSLIPNSGLVLDPQMKPPNDLQSKLLRQIVLSGLGDHVARKLMLPSGATPEDAKKLRHAYQNMTLQEPVYIHPSSVLHHLNKEFVVYQTIEETSGKLYMKGVTAIDPSWLPVFVRGECRNLTAVKDSDVSLVPRYDPGLGVVVHHVTCSFGPQYWQLPRVEVEYKHCLEQLKWFAQFVLDGSVFDKLKPFVKVLLSPPSLMTKQWAHLQPRTVSFLNALSDQNVFNRQQLTAAWASNPTYLLKEYCEWLPESHHASVTALWPPV